MLGQSHMILSMQLDKHPRDTCLDVYTRQGRPFIELGHVNNSVGISVDSGNLAEEHRSSSSIWGTVYIGFLLGQ